jgi:hypothetical protein
MKEPGERVGRYLIVGLLGRGGMGEVYEAEDTLLGRRVALKLVALDRVGQGDASPDARDRMLREARSAALFEHPNAVVVLDAGVVEDGPAEGETFLALELVRGQTVRALMDADPKPALARRYRWLVDAARALGAAHEKGLVHRDIKPDNLMVREDGVLKVLDFGIAKRLSGSVDASAPTEGLQATPNTLTQAGTIVGTPRYASPEQLQGEELDPRSDQWSWAVTAYEILGGAVPFDATDAVSLVAQVLGKQPAKLSKLNPEIPKPITDAVTRCLSKSKDARFESIAEAADILERFAEARTSTGTTAATPPKKPGVAKRVVFGAGKTVLYVATGIGLLFMGAIVVGAIVGKLHFDVNTNASASASPAPAPAAPLRLECDAATMPGASDDLARAVGVGACARLGVELGVEWSPKGAASAGASATPVVVTATAGPPASVTIAVGEVSTTAEGKTLRTALRAAAVDLAQRLPHPTLDPARLAAWGADREPVAHAVESTWRRLVMDDLDDETSRVRELADELPENAWAHAMVAVVEPRGTGRQNAARERAIALADKLPPARAKAVRGLMMVYGPADDRPEGLRLLRQAYDEDPADADIAGLYGSVAIMMDALDEGLGVVERVADTSPGQAIVPLRNAISGPRRFDHERSEKYLARLIQVWPEDRGSAQAFSSAIARRDMASAKATLEFRRAFSGKSEPLDFDELTLLLLDGSFAAVRDAARRGMAAASPLVRNQAGPFVTASYFLEGRLAEGHGAEVAELGRLMDEGNKAGWARHVLGDLRVRRRLGEPVARELTELADPLAIRELSLPNRLLVAGEIALTERSKPELVRTLEELERAAATARQDESAAARLALLPLVRAARGDEAAAKLWRSAQGDAGVRAAVALDAALALEAGGGSDAEIAEALSLAADPSRVDLLPIDFLCAAVRLLARKSAGGPLPHPDFVATLSTLTSKVPTGLREQAAALR